MEISHKFEWVLFVVRSYKVKISLHKVEFLFSFFFPYQEPEFYPSFRRYDRLLLKVQPCRDKVSSGFQ